MHKQGSFNIICSIVTGLIFFQSSKLEEWKDFLKRFLDWGDTKWCQPIMSQLVDDPTKITPIIDEILTVFI